MYEGSSWSPASGDARLLRLEVVCVSSTPAVGEQKTSLSMLVEINIITHYKYEEDIIVV